MQQRGRVVWELCARARSEQGLKLTNNTGTRDESIDAAK